MLLLITVGYAAFQTNLSITAKGNVKEKSRVIQAWKETSQTDFHSDFYKQNIVSASFLDNADVPDNATESWNVSEDKEHGGVMAWVVPNNEDSTKYDLYIGAKDGVIANEDSKYLFALFTNLKVVDFANNFDTANTVDMGAMFSMFNSTTQSHVKSSLTTINFGTKFDTSNVTSMSSMFNGCTELVNFDISNFDTSNVTRMGWMFEYCSSLTSIDLSNFDTSNVTTMAGMFVYCSNLKEIDFTKWDKWDTSKVTDMNLMFAACTNLESINISNFDTSHVTNMNRMFSTSPNLKEINLCSFDTTNVIDMQFMFAGTTNLNQIKVSSKWSDSQASKNNMFSGSGVSEVTTGQC